MPPTLTQEQFQDTVLKGIEAQGSKTDALVKDYDRLSGDTKKAFEDLTLLKKNANDSAGQMEEFTKKLTAIDTLLRKEARLAFGNPIRRIQQDEEMRIRFNMAARLMVDSGGDMMRMIRSKYPTDLVKRALGEDSSPGSTMIDDRLANEIYDTLASYGIWNTFRVQRMGTKQTKFPVKTARPVCNVILTEGGTISDDSNKSGTNVTLEVEVLGTLLNVSLQLIQDSEFDVTADVLNDFAEATAYKIDWMCTQADGGADATDGGMTGVFGGGATAAAAAAGNPTTEQTDLEDWTKCLLTVDPVVLNRGARWWIHPQHIVRALSVKDLNGRPIFLTATEAPSAGGIGSILGYPVTPTMAAPTANVATTRVAVFGDPAGQVVGIRNDFAFESSDHHTWDTYQRSFRGIARAGTKIRRALAFAALTTTA